MQEILKQEIIRVSNIESGLHFNASHACSTDILGFDLSNIACKFEDIAPSTWEIIQTLLDSNKVAHHHKSPTQVANYDDHYRLENDNLEDMPRIDGSESSEDEDVLVDGDESLDHGDKIHHREKEGMKRSAGDQNNALLHIVSSMRVGEYHETLTYATEGMCYSLHNIKQHQFMLQCLPVYPRILSRAGECS